MTGKTGATRKGGQPAGALRAEPVPVSGGAAHQAHEEALDYRISWPRPATACDLAPRWMGEFRDFNDWVNFAKTRLTGTRDILMGGEVKAICIDAFGRRCTMGGHFMRAHDEDAFPVRYFWECEPARARGEPSK